MGASWAGDAMRGNVFKVRALDYALAARRYMHGLLHRSYSLGQE